MSIEFVQANLSVATADKYAAYRVRFERGLNVIEAPNSWGKSTLVQGLVYGLGLEGSFSASHLSPLGEAMTSSIELDDQRQAVMESYVTLTVKNDRGQYLRTRRWAASLTRQRHLIQTWTADTEEGLNAASPVDMFVREGGAATRELGFHHYLAEFIGWSLPSVPTFSGGEVPLYLEVLFPMFYVEQKYGWSGLAPRIPTHYKVRAPYRRAAEYVLGLESLERIKAAERARENLAAAREAAQVEQAALESDLRTNGWRLAVPLDLLVGASEESRLIPKIEAPSGDGWLPVEEVLERLGGRLAELNEIDIVIAGERTDEAQGELIEAEAAALSLGSSIRRDQEFADTVRIARDTLITRLKDLEHDRTRLLDIGKLEKLGSELSLTSLSAAHCPTCSQSLDAAQVATGLVLDVATNAQLLGAERLTVQHLLHVEESRLAEVDARVGLLSASLREARRRIRSLKDELAGPSSAPSVLQVRERLELESRITSMRASLDDITQSAENVILRLSAVAALAAVARALGGQSESDGDRRIISRFRSSFRSALQSYGFGSLPVDEVTISDDTLLPEHDGFELTFDINHGLSASDTIRSKWAFYTSLVRAATQSQASHHLGTLIMDEPRQQEAKLDSVNALYKDLAALGEDVQVIVASSASRADLDVSLEGLMVNRIQAEQVHLLSPVSASDPRLT